MAMDALLLYYKGMDIWWTLKPQDESITWRV